jgi:hypothetical protein
LLFAFELLPQPLMPSAQFTIAFGGQFLRSSLAANATGFRELARVADY